jgi:hypothetical protein
MRSVTFADEKVVDTLNDKFVLCWNNHAADGDGAPAGAAQPKWTAEELERYPEGGGGGNVRTFVALADGRIVHYVQGWFRPEAFLDELAFALTLDEKTAADRHAAHVREHQAEQEKIERTQPEEMRKSFAASATRRAHARLGLQAQTHGLAQGMLLQPLAGIISQIREESLERGVIK